MIQKLQATYHRFPGKFWVLILAVTIDLIGGTMLNPFFALYITHKFSVGMSTAGVLLGLLAFFGLIGNIISGVLVDHIGRRAILLLGLILSAISALSLAFVNSLPALYPLIIIVGILSNFGGPARDTMVADLLPEERRNEGFGILRVASNLAWIIGPTLGGWVATHSFLLLFVLDALFSCITAGIVFLEIPETKPQPLEHQAEEKKLGETILGYRPVLRDRRYLIYLLISMLMLVVYQQEYNTLSVFMRDVRHFSAEKYGLLLSISAVLVVLLQIPISKKIAARPPFLMMTVGAIFFMLGFTLFGFIHAYALFVLAMVLITLGEMIISPVGEVLVVEFAPEAMRGRYLAFYSVAWALPSTIGPWAAGLIIDHGDPNWVWYLGGILLAFSALGFFLMHTHLSQRERLHPA